MFFVCATCTLFVFVSISWRSFAFLLGYLPPSVAGATFNDAFRSHTHFVPISVPHGAEGAAMLIWLRCFAVFCLLWHFAPSSTRSAYLHFRICCLKFLYFNQFDSRRCRRQHCRHCPMSLSLFQWFLAMTQIKCTASLKVSFILGQSSWLLLRLSVPPCLSVGVNGRQLWIRTVHGCVLPKTVICIRYALLLAANILTPTAAGCHCHLSPLSSPRMFRFLLCGCSNCRRNKWACKLVVLLLL